MGDALEPAPGGLRRRLERDPGRGRSGGSRAPGGLGRRVVLVGLAAAWLCAAAGARGDEVGLAARVVPCEMSHVEPGRSGSGWALLEGFTPDRRGQKRFAWLGRRAATLLVLGEPRARALLVEARASRPGLELALAVNGFELAPRSFDRAWSREVWEVPAEAFREGANRIELRPAKARRLKRKRPVAIALATLAVESPAGCGAEARYVTPVEPPFDLRPGLRLLLTGAGTARAPLEIGFRARWPKNRLELSCYGARSVAYVGSLAAGRGPAGALETVDPHPDCAEAAGLVVTARGPGVSRGVVARPAAGGFWTRGRRAVLEAALVVAAAALGLAGLARLRPRLPLERWAPALDVALVVLLALAVRLLFLFAYPFPGLSGDEHGYITGAERLLADRSRFWTETDWHAWLTYIRPPGYFLFLAALLGPLGGTRETVLLAQAALSALACGATYLMAYPLLGRGAAVASGLLLALYLGSVATFSRVLSEPLYIALVTSALAVLAWGVRRPSPGLAALAGVLFGAAALVRPAPVQFVLLAAALLLAIHGWRRGVRAAVLLVAATMLVALPFALRGWRLHGYWTGLETVSVANLLHAAPQERFVPHADLDLDDPEDAGEYYQRLKFANEDDVLSRRRGEILAAILREKAAHPLRTLRDAGSLLARFFGPTPEAYLRWILDERHAGRAARLTSLMNAQTLLIVGLGALGILLRIRDRRTWPLVLWVLLNVAVIAILFHVMERYRFGVMPVMAAFAGWTVAAALGRVAQRGAG